MCGNDFSLVRSHPQTTASFGSRGEERRGARGTMLSLPRTAFRVACRERCVLVVRNASRLLRHPVADASFVDVVAARAHPSRRSVGRLRVRIGIIAPPWIPVPPPMYGGTEAVLDTLARGLQDAGHDVLLFASGDSTCAVPTASIFPEGLGLGVSGSASELRHVIAAYEAMARVRSRRGARPLSRRAVLCPDASGRCRRHDGARSVHLRARRPLPGTG